MGFITTLATFGLWFGIDFLFWAWAIVTALAFIDLLIPDPLPFVDEAVLIMGSIGLLIALAVRGGASFIVKSVNYLSNPAVIAFVVTMAALLIGNAIYKKMNKRK
jgi:hypothetical protein